VGYAGWVAVRVIIDGMTEAGEAVAAGSGGEVAGRPARTGRARWKVTFVTLLVLGVLGTTAWVLFGSRLLVVRQVEVTGTHLVPRDRVVAVARIRLGGPMIRLDAGAVADRIAGIRQVESVRVERRWPATLQIAVRERVPVVVAGRGGRYYQIDRYGVPVLDTPRRPRGLPELAVTAPGPDDPGTAAALTVWRGLPVWFRERLAAIGASEPETVTLRLTSGTSVIWGAPERAAEKIRLVSALLEAPAGRSARTIDVSAPEVVTTR
jgi:cell division protein FtsQ